MAEVMNVHVVLHIVGTAVLRERDHELLRQAEEFQPLLHERAGDVDPEVRRGDDASHRPGLGAPEHPLAGGVRHAQAVRAAELDEGRDRPLLRDAVAHLQVLQHGSELHERGAAGGPPQEEVAVDAEHLPQDGVVRDHLLAHVAHGQQLCEHAAHERFRGVAVLHEEPGHATSTVSH